VKQKALRNFQETLADLIAAALRWERLDITATPFRGDLLFRAPGQQLFILKCALGKGPLPFPVLQDLRAMPLAPGQPGAPPPPVVMVVTTHALDDRIWAAFTSSGILVLQFPAQERLDVIILHVGDMLMTLEKAAAGTATAEDIERVLRHTSTDKTAGATAGAAWALRQLRDYQQAAHLYSTSLRDLFYRLGGDDPAVLELRSQFADILFWDGRRDEAQRELEVVYQRRALILGQGHPDTQLTLSKLQACQAAGGRTP
jgi:hypothetical protein